MCVFDLKSGLLEDTIALGKAAGGERAVVTSVAHHPHRNVLSTLDASGVLKFWTA